MRLCFCVAATVAVTFGAPVVAMPALDPPQSSVASDAASSGRALRRIARRPATSNRPSPLALPTLVARIDLTGQRLTVHSGGVQLHSWKISSGRAGHETPTGTYRPGWMAKQWYSRKYDMAPMPYSVFFNGGIATHGTTAVGRLGRPASHGCIRLRTANARVFYNLVRRHGLRNTRIIVTGRAVQTSTIVASANSASRSTSRPDRQHIWRQQSLGLPQVGFSLTSAD